MPFVSASQRRFMFSQHPEMAKEWAAHTPKGKKLPEHVKESALKVKTAAGAALKFIAQEVSQAARRRAAKKKEADMIKVGQFNAFVDELVKIKEAQGVAPMAAGMAQNMRGMAAQTGAGMMSGGARGMGGFGGGGSMGGGAGSSSGGGLMGGLRSFGSSVQNMLSTGGRGRGGGAGVSSGPA